MNLKHLLLSFLSAGHFGRAHRRFGQRLVAVAALALVIAVAFPSGAAQAKAPDKWVAGELLVGLRAGVGPTRAEEFFRAHGATVVSDVGQIRVVRIRVPVAWIDSVEWLLSRLPEVKFVEKNYIFDPVFVPDDPMYAAQWHLPQILAPQAWDLTQGSPGAVIAIVDSGVDPYHPDLAPNLVAGYNTYNNNTNTLDQYGHGTEVAGVAAASSNNGQGIASVAGQSRIMPIRVTDATGRATSATIANGLVWAADHGASVVNLSFESVAGNAAIRAAAEYVLNKGALVVAASGNCGCFDATADNPFILSVSATDETGGIAYFSSTGPYVDLAAPGTNILTTAVGGLYFSDSGTSLASPVVAGVAALMFSANPALTPTVVAELLEATAQDAGTAGYDTGFGFGRVNAYAAVAAAASYTPPPDTTPPTASITAPLPGATVTGTAVVNVSASDNVGVVKVDLYVDGLFLATDTSSPYSFAWDTTLASNGAHTLQAIATDAAGNNASTANISVTVSNTPPDTTPPIVAISAPAAGATVSGTITVTANASDNVGVTKVDFYVDGILRATDTSSPYSFAWDTTTASNGAHTLQAIATDAAGNNASTANISVTVSNTPPDTTSPIVAISAPASGAIVSGTITVTANASDNVGVTKVDFYVDGILRATDTSSPYSFAWDTTTASNGAHTLKAIASDAAGNTATTTITVTVANVNQPPIAANDAFAAPYRSGTSYTAQVFNVLANDRDPDGSLNAGSVKIVQAPNKGGTVTVNANGTVSYTPKKSYRGAETFTYNVKDNLGKTSNTATVTVTVQ
jgi:subtilisin family serine protease